MYSFYGEYLSLASASKKYGVEAGTISYRINKQHMTPEEAVSSLPQRNKLYPFRGQLRTLKYCAGELGVCVKTIKNYMKRGCNTVDEVERILNLARCKPRRIPDGCVYPDCFHCKFRDCLAE